MELRHCRYFAAIAEDLNITRAARRCNVSQPAISKQLKDLETELGVVLFDREHHGLRLTPAGEIFLVHAKGLLDRASMAAEAVRPGRLRSENIVTLGYVPTAMPAFLSDALRRAKASGSNLAIRLKGLSPQDQVRGLREGTLDIALLGNPPAAWKREFAARTLTRTPILAVLPNSHSLAGLASVDLSALAKDDFIGLAEQTFPGRNECIREACQRAGFVPRLTIFADSLTALIGMVGGGMGVALAPAFLEAHPHPGAKFIRLRRPRVFAESVAAWRRGETVESVDSIIEVLTESSAMADQDHAQPLRAS